MVGGMSTCTVDGNYSTVYGVLIGCFTETGRGVERYCYAVLVVFF
jgi:hypothetical protein